MSNPLGKTPRSLWILHLMLSTVLGRCFVMFHLAASNLYGGFHKWGTPNGWFIMENATPLSGNLHIVKTCLTQSRPMLILAIMFMKSERVLNIIIMVLLCIFEKNCQVIWGHGVWSSVTWESFQCVWAVWVYKSPSMNWWPISSNIWEYSACMPMFWHIKFRL